MNDHLCSTIMRSKSLISRPAASDRLHKKLSPSWGFMCKAISPQEIVSNVGVCTSGSSISAHVECKFAGGPLIGDITFTPRPDNTIEFIDRDMTYKTVLYRCPQ